MILSSFAYVVHVVHVTMTLMFCQHFGSAEDSSGCGVEVVGPRDAPLSFAFRPILREKKVDQWSKFGNGVDPPNP